jgi:hypothetical protein
MQRYGQAPLIDNTPIQSPDFMSMLAYARPMHQSNFAEFQPGFGMKGKA